MMSRLEAAIIAAAIRLFARQGYRQTTIKEIAASARTTSASIHCAFGGKDHLFAQALTTAVAVIVDPQAFIHDFLDYQINLLQEAGKLVMQALTSRNKEWRRIVLAALARTSLSPELPGKHQAPADPKSATHLRVVEFTEFRRSR